MKKFLQLDKTQDHTAGDLATPAQPELSRRRFLQAAAVTGVSAVVPAAAVTMGAPAAQAQAAHAARRRRLPAPKLPNPIIPNFPGLYGSSQVRLHRSPNAPWAAPASQVSILGMGGYHLGTAASQDVVNDMVAKALDHGINFFDNAWEYHNGMSEERLGIALKGKRDQAILMTGVCTYGRKKDVAMRQLEDSLTRLQTDHLDVWQVHDVIYYNDPELAYDADGVLEALTLAKQQGKVRFVGFTGHKNPSIHLDMLNRGFHFDTVQMPINPFDPSFRSFENNVLPVALQKRMAVISDEEHERLRRVDRAWRAHSDRSALLCDERPRRLDHRLGHGEHGGPRPEPRDPQQLQAARREADGRPARACAGSSTTAATNSTRCR